MQGEKKNPSKSQPAITLSPNENDQNHHPILTPPLENIPTCEIERQPPQNVLKRIGDFNKKGLAETPAEGGTQSRLRGGKDY